MNQSSKTCQHSRIKVFKDFEWDSRKSFGSHKDQEYCMNLNFEVQWKFENIAPYIEQCNF